MPTTAIRKWNYGHYKSDNYGGHSMAVQVGSLTLYFSYDTVIAFREAGHSLRVCENAWSTTTGKHLNWLDGGNKADRLPFNRFQSELENVLAEHKLSV